MRRILALVAAVAAAASLAASAAAGTHYADPPGDSGAAPDIVAVDVSDDGAGNVTFVATMAPRPTFASDESVDVFVNSDENRATGSTASGSEYAIDVTSTGWALYRWDGSAFARVSTHGPIAVDPPAVNPDAFIVRTTIGRADLGNTRAFSFFVQTSKGTGASTDPFDTAPDGTGVYSYTVSGIAMVKSIGADVPRVARPGRVVKLSNFDVTLNTGARARPSAITCKATVAGRPLKRTGGCAFAVPRSAAGKKVVVVVSVTYQGESYSTRFTVKVAKK